MESPAGRVRKGRGPGLMLACSRPGGGLERSPQRQDRRVRVSRAPGRAGIPKLTDVQSLSE